MRVQGDRFVFEDGTEARFWGGNLFGEANFPDQGGLVPPLSAENGCMHYEIIQP